MSCCLQDGNACSRRAGTVTIVTGDAGFSLLELMIVLAIFAIAAGVAVLSFTKAMRGAHINSTAQITVNQLRLAHEEAVDRRMQYTVTFVAPGTIVTQRTTTAAGTVTESTVTLPSDVQFDAEPGLPALGQTPDGFGQGKVAFDFDQAAGGGGTVIIFNPDGTAVDGAGNLNDGVVYMAIPGELYSSRAVSMWGATGRFKVWTLQRTVGGPKWQ